MASFFAPRARAQVTGSREAAGLKGTSGVGRFVFDVELVKTRPATQALRALQRGETLAEGDDFRRCADGHDFPIAPHRRRAGAERGTGQRVASPVQVVAGEEGRTNLREVVQRVGVVARARAGAL